MGKRSVVLVIPDTHFPFHHEKTILFLKALKKEYRPDIIVHLGDEVDAHALGKWDSDPDGMSAGFELRAALEQLKELYDIFPKVAVCESNHGKRPFRKAFESGIPRAYMRAYREFMEAPSGWEWRDVWDLNNVIYLHGEGYTGRDGAIKAALNNRKSTVIGHIHSWGGIQYSAVQSGLIFGLNSGCLIDHDAYAFKYAKNYPHKATMGASIVYSHREAYFIPLK